MWFRAGLDRFAPVSTDGGWRGYGDVGVPRGRHQYCSFLGGDRSGILVSALNQSFHQTSRGGRVVHRQRV